MAQSSSSRSRATGRTNSAGAKPTKSTSSPSDSHLTLTQTGEDETEEPIAFSESVLKAVCVACECPTKKTRHGTTATSESLVGKVRKPRVFIGWCRLNVSNLNATRAARSRKTARRCTTQANLCYTDYIEAFSSKFRC
eukprot:CAMPEP_0169146214 /NCGR_PEP_ID=MMETSP1015-20121227/47406_1 /TAXON_ID=342587 /ORGANISM="Karlodinium micrum, Strain CCMP2283" /LENGTH=137 /DNA_ID=CAMNT_0009214017 /DNA_START=299 /DNA_END=712 /DNA_ORIENTATION=+